ncbi:MAG: HAMP domain-containing sensor histidine kinase [Clostridium sp.]
MKDKPLSFQIWVVITVFIVIVSVVVSLTTTILISNLADLSIVITSAQFWGTMLKLLLCIIIVSIIIAKMISSRITKPISYLEKKVRLISVKKWDEKIKMNRKDEIGKLAYSIGKMQESLINIDKEEEFFIQSISHELKTPIMVIRNYCQAIKDGFYIEDSFEKNIEVIEEEVERLESKIIKLLYLNSLDYILEKESEFKPVEAKSFLKSIVNRISLGRKDLEVEVKGEPVCINVIEDKFRVAIENILENSLRYARSRLTIEIQNKFIDMTVGEITEISIYNDGNAIEEAVIDNLFSKFHKGKNGNFGLGLFISNKIIKFHNGNIKAENCDNGVKFIIDIK